MAIADVDLYRWTREEYERLAAAGFFHPAAAIPIEAFFPWERRGGAR